MKHVKPDKVTLEMTYEEAKIIQCVFAMLLSEDPYGDASNNLGIHINKVVQVGREFEELLAKAI